MNARFVHRALHEQAYTRRARLILEVRDPVTFEPVWDGIEIKVKGLEAEPIVSSGGRFVWFEEKGATPLELTIDPGTLPYALPRTVPVPPLPAPPPPPGTPTTWNDLTVELAPSTAYPFSVGVTVLRGTIVLSLADDPPVFPDRDVRLQWIDDNQPGIVWMNAPTVSRTSAKGDFAAMVRLAPNQIARADAQHRMRVRVAASIHNGVTQFSPELQIPFGHVTDAQQRFAWDALLP
jgi:hypothetical protein